MILRLIPIAEPPDKSTLDFLDGCRGPGFAQWKGEQRAFNTYLLMQADTAGAINNTAQAKETILSEGTNHWSCDLVDAVSHLPVR